eukprot:scaffold95715_cov33-Tisochrysis_lutea.AAC.3
MRGRRAWTCAARQASFSTSPYSSYSDASWSLLLARAQKSAVSCAGKAAIGCSGADAPPPVCERKTSPLQP